MRRVRLWGALSLATLAGAPAIASGQILASSTFDAGTQGWENGDFFAPTGTDAPQLITVGGNRFIRVNDNYGWNAFQAPAAFLGNQSAAYGGSLRLDLRIVSGDGPTCQLVTLGNGATTLAYLAPQPANNSWTSFVVPLLASAGWVANPSTGGCGGGVAASEAQLQTVLGGLTFLNVNADWQSGFDQVDLDNVYLLGPAGIPGVVPEPATVTLVAAGVLTLGAVARRRARQA